jgi:hypothetical protein
MAGTERFEMRRAFQVIEVLISLLWKGEELKLS